MPNLSFVKTLSSVVLEQFKKKRYKNNGEGYLELKTIVGYLCDATGYKNWSENSDDKDIERALNEMAQGKNINKKIINNIKLRGKIINYLNDQPDSYGFFTSNDLKFELAKILDKDNPNFKIAHLMEMQLEDQKRYIKEKESEFGDYDIELDYELGFADLLHNVVVEYQEKASKKNPELLNQIVLADMEKLKTIISESKYGQSYKIMTKDTVKEQHHSLLEATVKHRIVDSVKLGKEVLSYYRTMQNSEFKQVIAEVLRTPAYGLEKLMETDIRHYKAYIKALEKAQKEKGQLKEKEEHFKQEEVLEQEKNKNRELEERLKQQEEQMRKMFREEASKLQTAMVAPPLPTNEIISYTPSQPKAKPTSNESGNTGSYDNVMDTLKEFFAGGAKLRSHKEPRQIKSKKAMVKIAEKTETTISANQANLEEVTQVKTMESTTTTTVMAEAAVTPIIKEKAVAQKEISASMIQHTLRGDAVPAKAAAAPVVEDNTPVKVSQVKTMASLFGGNTKKPSKTVITIANKPEVSKLISSRANVFGPVKNAETISAVGKAKIPAEKLPEQTRDTGQDKDNAEAIRATTPTFNSR